MRRTWIIVGLSLISLFTNAARLSAKQRPVTLLVSAASSLTFALQELGPLFEQASGTKVIYNFGATGQLAQQIERGAPVDLFAAANVTFIDMLERQGLIIPDSKMPYARGRLTLWTRIDSPLRLARLEDLTRAEVRRIAIANPTHAPYGMAAREALQATGLWAQLQLKLVMGENIRQTLQYAATGNVDAALVSLSLSVQHAGRWVRIPAYYHRPIIQTLAVLKRTRYETQARQFAGFITGAQGQPIMQKYGFGLPAEDVRP